MRHLIRSRGARLAMLVLSAAAAIAAPACRFRGRPPAVLAEPDTMISGRGLVVSAHFAREADGPESFLWKRLPRHGFVAVRISMRNEGSERLVIHAANGLPIGETFGGVALLVDGERFEPVAARDVLRGMTGSDRAYRYRRLSTGKLTGLIIFPPLGGAYIYDEVKFGRFMRKLCDRSLLPVLDRGMMKPLDLEPGASKTGFLYFAVPRERLPHAVLAAAEEAAAPKGEEAPTGVPLSLEERRRAAADSARAIEARARGDDETHAYELLVTACAPSPSARAHPIADCAFTRIERLRAPGGSPAAPGEAPAFVFSLGMPGHAGKAELLMESLASFVERPDAPPSVAALVASRGLAIADASTDGARAACAVNFKSKSRVFILEPGSKPRMAGNRAFSRRLVRAFLAGDALFAVTSDGFCYHLSGTNFETVRYERIARDLDDAALAGGRLLAFERSRGVTGFGVSGEQLLRQVERRELPAAERRFGAVWRDRLLVVNVGDVSGRDTLAVLDLATLREHGRLPLPGAALAIASDGEDCVVQLADGTLLDLSIAPDGAPRIAGAAYLPFAARALAVDGGRIAALGKDGSFAAGAIGEFDPGARAVVTLRCAIGH